MKALIFNISAFGNSSAKRAQPQSPSQFLISSMEYVSLLISKKIEIDSTAQDKPLKQKKNDNSTHTPPPTYTHILFVLTTLHFCHASSVDQKRVMGLCPLSTGLASFFLLELV